jgi:hypothetical protein
MNYRHTAIYTGGSSRQVDTIIDYYKKAGGKIDSPYDIDYSKQYVYLTWAGNIMSVTYEECEKCNIPIITMETEPVTVTNVSIDKVTVQNLQYVLSQCYIHLNDAELDIIVDAVEILMSKGNNITYTDIQNLKNTHYDRK